MQIYKGMKNLNPMNEDKAKEIHSSKIETDNFITKEEISENIFELHSPNNTVYGDFSLNSFLIVDTPEEEKKEDSSFVYMESIIDLIQSLNTKIDTLRSEKSEERLVLQRVMSFLTIGDSRSAEEAIQTYNQKGNNMAIDILINLVQKTLPKFFIDLKEELLNTKEIALTLKNLHSETETKLFKKLEENERLKNIISQQSKDHKLQLEKLSAENCHLKDELLKLVTEYGTNCKIESLLEEDILLTVKKIIKEKLEEITVCKEELIEKDKILREYHLKENSFDISHLNNQVESYKKIQKKLQDENLNLTQIVNKLSEKNTKLKQELIFFNSELKKTMDVVTKKNETISRQKSLIELFQEKLSGSSFPIEELRKKKAEIEKKLAEETDYFVKQNLKKESKDCEKRLSDFLSLNRKF